MAFLPKDIAGYLFIKSLGLGEGDLHLEQDEWGISRALIHALSVETLSVDWDLWILQNGNGFAADDANVPKLQVMAGGNGGAHILLNLPYEDEDGEDRVHFYYVDNSGANSMGIYVKGMELA